MTLSEEFEIRIATYEEVEGYMTDEALGAVFRNLIHEMAEKRRTVSERQRKNVKKRYQKATTSLPNAYQTPTNQLPTNLPDDATPPPPTPPISEREIDKTIYINNINTISGKENSQEQISISLDTSTSTSKQSFDTSTSASKPPGKFVIPTVEEVAAYCKEKNYDRDYGIDPEEFIAFYEMRGWKLKGNLPMKSWKGAVVTWVKARKKEDAEQRRQQQFGKYRYHNQTAENRANEDLSWIKRTPKA